MALQPGPGEGSVVTSNAQVSPVAHRLSRCQSCQAQPRSWAGHVSKRVTLYTVRVRRALAKGPGWGGAALDVLFSDNLSEKVTFAQECE